MNALVMHAPVEESEKSADWWAESAKIHSLLPIHAKSICCIDANGRVGYRCSEAIGDVEPDEETHMVIFSLVAD